MAAEVKVQRRICALFCAALVPAEVWAGGTPGSLSEVRVTSVVCTRLQAQGEEDHDREGQLWVTASLCLHLPVESPAKTQMMVLA